MLALPSKPPGLAQVVGVQCVQFILKKKKKILPLEHKSKCFNMYIAISNVVNSWLLVIFISSKILNRSCGCNYKKNITSKCHWCDCNSNHNWNLIAKTSKTNIVSSTVVYLIFIWYMACMLILAANEIFQF